MNEDAALTAPVKSQGGTDEGGTDEGGADKSKGEIYEGIAFSFCKAATILLLIYACGLSRFALPIMAALTAIFYVLAHAHGQRDTRCILQKPLLVAAFWSAIGLSAFFLIRR